MVSHSRLANVCMDTCVFVNFAIIRRVDLFSRISEFLFHVHQEVINEVTVAAQRQLLNEMLENGGLKKTELREVSELTHFAEYSKTFGKGESACLALAVCRRWVIATDESKDRRLKREIEASKIQIINTPGLLLTAIQRGVLTIGDADAIKEELERNRFKMNFRSFRELMGGS